MGRQSQRCDSCRDSVDFADGGAIAVTGNESGRTHFVHRPSTPDRSMCFRWGVNGREQQSLDAARSDPAAIREGFDVLLAMEVGLDERGCKAVGVSWARVREVRAAGRRRRAAA